MDAPQPHEVFASELLPGEQIVWSGRPDPHLVFAPRDLLLVPFSLLWGGFAFFWEAAALGFVSARPDRHAPVFFPLFGIPFVLMGLYVTFGRFLYARWVKERTWFAVTDRRVLILSMGLQRRLEAFELQRLGAVTKANRSGDAGTLTFGESASLPLGSLQRGVWAPPTSAFYDIHEVDSVYRLIEARRVA